MSGKPESFSPPPGHGKVCLTERRAAFRPLSLSVCISIRSLFVVVEYIGISAVCECV